MLEFAFAVQLVDLLSLTDRDPINCVALRSIGPFPFSRLRIIMLRIVLGARDLSPIYIREPLDALDVFGSAGYDSAMRLNS